MAVRYLIMGGSLCRMTQGVKGKVLTKSEGEGLCRVSKMGGEDWRLRD